MTWWQRIDLDDGLSLRRPIPADAFGVLDVHGDIAGARSTTSWRHNRSSTSIPDRSGRSGAWHRRPANAAARWVAKRAGFTDEGLESGVADMQLLRLEAPDQHPLEPST